MNVPDVITVKVLEAPKPAQTRMLAEHRHGDSFAMVRVERGENIPPVVIRAEAPEYRCYVEGRLTLQGAELLRRALNDVLDGR